MANKTVYEIIAKALGFGKAGKKVKTFSGSLKSMAAGLATAAAAYKALGVAVDSVNLAGELEGVESSFNNLRKEMNFSTGTFSKLDKALNGTVDRLTIMKQANSAMLLGIADSDDQMAQMFDTAQRLAKAVGQDATFGIESLVTGLGRQSKLMLDNLGIMVDVNKANIEYAATLKKTASELTEGERKQAFINKALSEGQRLADQLGDEFDTTADQIKTFSATYTNLQLALGEAIVDVGILSWMDTLATSITGLLEIRRNEIDIADRAGTKYGDNTDRVNELNEQHDILADKLLTLRENITTVTTVTGSYGEQIEIVNRKAREGADFTAEEIIQYEILHGKIRKVSAEIDNLIDSYEAEEERKRLSIEFIKAEVRMNELLEDSSSSLAQNVIDNNEETGKSYQNMTSDLDDYISKIMERQVAEGITFDMLDEGTDRYEEMKQREVELAMGAANQTLGAWQNATNERMKNDLNALKATGKYEKASADQKKAMEKKVTDEYKTQRQAQFRLNQASNLADIYMSTASAIMEAAPNVPLQVAMGVAGAIQAGVVLSQQMPEYQYGGLIGGNTHAQGGTPLIAEQGEYIVNRDAVESLGIDTMDSINAGGGAGMVINITGNLLTDDFVEDVLIEKIQDAVYRGGELA